MDGTHTVNAIKVHTEHMMFKLAKTVSLVKLFTPLSKDLSLMESCEFNLQLQPNSFMWEHLVVYLRGEVFSTDTSQKRWLANNPSNN